ncbi:DmsC/YnfH family molybdoenzyme membrane anchor subunit [Chloroflexota bacterium]
MVCLLCRRPRRGLYLVSLYFNSFWGMLAGWAIVALLKGGLHLAFLGKPMRFWRIMLRPQASWLARGFVFVLLFSGLGAVQLVASSLMPGSILEVVLKGLVGMSAFAVAIYTGFVLNDVKAVPFWNSRLLPLLFVLCGILGGFGLSVVIAISGGNISLHAAEIGSQWVLILNIALIVTYLWRAMHRSETGKKSVLEQLQGGLAPVFWIGVVACGIIIPIIAVFARKFLGDLSTGLILGGVACEVIGGFSLRYCVLKAGAYEPLVTVSSLRRPRLSVVKT